MKKIEAICSACGGAGLYEGCFEEKGYPVICSICNGSGCEIIKYTLFVERKLRRGIKGVMVNQRTKQISYKQFLKEY